MSQTAPNAFQPKELFLFGQLLVQGAARESEFRTVIGRAYYACHLSARDQLFDLDGRLVTSRIRKQLTSGKGTRGGSHELIIRALASHGRLTPGLQKRLSDQLSQLKDMRVQADYIMDHGTNARAFTKYNAQGWPGLAHAAMTLASSLLPDLLKLPRFRP